MVPFAIMQAEATVFTLANMNGGANPVIHLG